MPLHPLLTVNGFTFVDFMDTKFPILIPSLLISFMYVLELFYSVFLLSLCIQLVSLIAESVRSTFKHLFLIRVGFSVGGIAQGVLGILQLFLFCVPCQLVIDVIEGFPGRPPGHSPSPIDRDRGPGASGHVKAEIRCQSVLLGNVGTIIIYEAINVVPSWIVWLCELSLVRCDPVRIHACAKCDVQLISVLRYPVREDCISEPNP